MQSACIIFKKYKSLKHRYYCFNNSGNMKKTLIALIISLAFVPVTLQAQSYAAMWKDVETAKKQDLPRKQMTLIEKIADKARAEKNHGQLLEAELRHSAVLLDITPDSLQPIVTKFEREAAEAEKEDKVLAAVYYSVLGKIYNRNRMLGEDHATVAREYYRKSLANPDMLASHTVDNLGSLIEKGEDSRFFGNNLLSMLCMEAGDYETLRNWYAAKGDRRAEMMSAYLLLTNSGYKPRRAMIASLDSLIGIYADLPECGIIAVKRCETMNEDRTFSTKERIDYIDYALGKWGKTYNMNNLVNMRNELTQPEFNIKMERNVVLPGKASTLWLTELRNIGMLKISVSLLKGVDGTTKLNPSHVYDYNKLKPMIVAGSRKVYERKFAKHPEYVTFADSVVIDGMPCGVYLVEAVSDNKNIGTQRSLLYVTDLYVMQQQLPQKKIRYAVVSATTGQPVPGAKLWVDSRRGGAKVLTCGNDGETIYSYGVNEPYQLRPYTATDKAFPRRSAWSNFSYYPNKTERDYVNIYTDRAIYRPGQTVHVSAVAFRNKHGEETSACDGRQMKLVLKDANHKTVKEVSVTTDAYGTVSADFTLPATGLTGMFSVRTDMGQGATRYFRVEEYKRPTFKIEFDEVNKEYRNGDTLVVKGRAKTFAGVPVQGAKVSYTVDRSSALWWRFLADSNGDEQLEEAETVTDDEGLFEIRMPMLLPDDEDDDEEDGISPYKMPARFYTITASADVTDAGGETQHGSLALPLGSKPTFFACDMPEKTERDSLKTIRFILKNAVGKDIEGDIRYSVDGSDVYTAQANKPVPVDNIREKLLVSGRHKLTAVCGNDTIEKEFVVFSLEDTVPCVQTDEWFYTTSNTFPRGGGPVYVQIGTSDEDVHVLYTLITGDRVIDSRVIKLSNSVETAMFEDCNDIEGGVLLNFAWVKNGVMHKYSTTIERPLPDKRLVAKWTTFRDRLTPGQKEEWTLNVTRPDGTPAKAQLMATLYDKSLDVFEPHNWTFNTQISRNMPYTSWSSPYMDIMRLNGAESLKSLKTHILKFNKFDNNYFMSSLLYGYKMMVRGLGVMKAEAKMADSNMLYDTVEQPALQEVVTVGYGVSAKKSMSTGSVAVENAAEDAGAEYEDVGGQSSAGAVQVRENLNETAFFYPSLATDDNGNVNIRFTLPESVTTWRFMGLVHDRDMNNGLVYGDAVAKKDIMVQPNMPRFVRSGDNATISVRVFNTSESDVTGKVRMELVDPETEKIVYKSEMPVTVDANGTGNVVFGYSPDDKYTLLICRVVAEGKTFSDGEQHYLPILPSMESVIRTLPFVQHGAGTKTLDVEKMFPAGTKNATLTVEYTNNPAWLAVQALPFVSNVSENNAISLAAAYYANSLGAHIVKQSPRIKTVFEQWKNEPAGTGTSLMSALEKNSELKTLVLDETPWVADAEDEADRKRRISNFFDASALENRMGATLESLRKLQNNDGSWSWWKGMDGSSCITLEVAEFLVRLDALAGKQSETSSIISRALKYLGNEAVKEVEEMKRMEKEGRAFGVNGYHALQFLYINTLSGRTLTAKEKEAARYFMDYLMKKKETQSIYAKALMSIVLAGQGKTREAKEYVQSLKEYTVMTEAMGRYYDTPRAGYSWLDYRIPTQVAAMEAISRVSPEDVQTVDEMRRWLLQQKRTQDWGTPVNSVNAIYAFLNGNTGVLDKGEDAVLAVDGKRIDTSAGTAGLGYVKTSMDGEKVRTFTATKTSDGTSWGALYARFMQNTAEVETHSAGLEVKREIISGGKKVASAGADAVAGPSVGNRVTVRITVKADRDYDFVQVTDKRAACLEPVQQLTGYGWGYYCTSKDYTTNFYFDRMKKGTHIIEKEYYVDREGSYETGTCTVQCAYAPEFMARDRSLTIKVR